MTADTERVLRLSLEPVAVWLSKGGDPEQMCRDYWHLRHVYFADQLGIDPAAQTILSGLDVPLDLFWADADPHRPPEPYSITEAQVRSEALGVMRGLQALGYLLDWQPARDIR